MRKIALMLILTLVFFGCTRAQQDQSKISIAFPKSIKHKASTLALEVKHLVFNISRGDEVLVCNWDSHEPNFFDGPCKGNNESFSIEVPMGEWLIQVFIVNGSSDSTSFLYGDVKKNLVASQETADIQLSNISTAATTLVSGKIQGRYFEANGHGPTGALAIKYKPNGKPSMLIGTSVIFDGWFNAFAIDSLNFEYVVDNGQILFGGAQSLNYFINNGKAVALRIPPGDHEEYYSILGFYGDAAMVSNKKVCFETAATTIDGASYVATSTDSSKAYIINGSSLLANNTCTGVEYSDYLLLRTKQNLSIKPPFKPDSSGKFLSESVQGTGKLLTWNFLPGIDAQTIDGISAYALTNPDDTNNFNIDVFGDALFDCKRLELAALNPLSGITLFSSIPVAQNSLLVENTGALSDIIFCPKKNSQPLFATLNLQNLKDNGSDLPYIRIEYGFPFVQNNSSTNSAVITKGKCYSGKLVMYKNAQRISLSEATTYNFTNTVGKFYTTSACTTVLPSISIAASSFESAEFYYRNDDTPTVTSFQIPITPQTTSVSYYSDWFALAKPQIKVLGPATMIQDLCYKVDIQTFEANGKSYYNVPTALTFSLTNSGSVGQFYEDETCTTPLSTPTIPVATNSKAYYFKPNIANTTTIDASAGTDYDSTSLTSTVIASSKLFTQIALEWPDGTPKVGVCNKLKVKLVNQAGLLVPAKESMSIELGGFENNGGLYWYDLSWGSCGSILSSNQVNFQRGQSEVLVGYRPLTNDAVTFKLNTFTQIPIGGSFSQTPVTPPAGSDPWITYTLPTFNGSKIIGSHEFGTSMNIVLSGSDTNFECAETEWATDTTVWGNCSGKLVGNTFRWDLTDILPAANSMIALGSAAPADIKKFSFRIKDMTDHKYHLSFNPINIYGSNFRIYSCNTVASGVKTDPIIAANQIYCLDVGASITSTTSSMMLSQVKLIGHSSKNSLQITSSTGQIIISQSSATEDTVLANLNITATIAGNANPIFNINGAPSSAFTRLESLNLELAYGNGINLSNTSNLNARNILMNNLKASKYGINVSSSSSLELSNITLTNIAGNATGINITSSSAPAGAIHIKGLNISANTNFKALYQSCSSNSINTFLENANIFSDAGSSNFLFETSGACAELQVKESKIKGGTSFTTNMAFLYTSANGNLKLYNSHLISSNDGQIIYNTSGSSVLLGGNHFVKNASGSTQPALASADSTAIFRRPDLLAPNHGNNVFCAQTVGGWPFATYGYINGAFASDSQSINFSSPTRDNTGEGAGAIDSNSLRCVNPNWNN